MDNSTKSTGWAVLDVDPDKKGNERYTLVDYDTIKRNNKNLQEMLAVYEETVYKLIDDYKPDCISAEQMFVSTNRKTAMSLAFIHAVMLLCAYKRNVPVTYYAVMTLKSKILGGIKVKKEDGTRKTGKEMKQEVQNKVIEILGKENFTKKYNDDVTDAMSAAIVYDIMDGETI